jgi:hypothetical protein
VALDIEGNIKAYLGARNPTDRYASFDYCFNHFQSFKEQGRTVDLAVGPNLELSCLHLGFYLASWGMYRGSTDLLQHSLKYLEPVVGAIATAPPSSWEADVDTYGEAICRDLLGLAAEIRRALPAGATDTLVTKIMLGVFGSVPAFDTNFQNGSGRRSLGRASLLWLSEFYQSHSREIDRYRVYTLDFGTGNPTSRRYSRAKVIDMIFFIEGLAT